MRTWKCTEPDCDGESFQASYDWIAKNGNPVCPVCDCEMELQPEAPAPDLLAACKDALGHAQLLGSGQPSPLSNAELCEVLGAAIAKEEKERAR